MNPFRSGRRTTRAPASRASRSTTSRLCGSEESSRKKTSQGYVWRIARAQSGTTSFIVVYRTATRGERSSRSRAGRRYGGRTRDRIRFAKTKAKLNRNTTIRANWARETWKNQFTVVAPKMTIVPIQIAKTRAKNRRPHLLSRSSLGVWAIGSAARSASAG
ncbi:MAG: hypothetical protein A3K65_00075 [Euryarchaeota archaeon RBG_16_68_12]|nr:MAG: hypothetical protein A3K65_00075 [Euryarchaeota archaeon RBG_16_68_12]